METIYILLHRYHVCLANWFRKQTTVCEKNSVFWGAKLFNEIKEDTGQWYEGGITKETEERLNVIRPEWMRYIQKGSKFKK